ncbi:MAG: hypothetical protein HY931_00725 [Candidatus Falkowbacteria bacterium]|nr:MAG: hypothetical protein HY931_00725 [Candidatus Falkowbacteria bacterium]
MKDDEIINKLLDLRADDIRQERELFKHIAILSSAVIGIFAFSGGQGLGVLSKIGVAGLFFVIILSVFLLFFVLTLERVRSVRAQDMITDVKKLKNEAILKTAISLFGNKKNIFIFKKIISGKEVKNSLESIIPILTDAWSNFTSCDETINTKKNELSNDKERSKDVFYRILSAFGVIIFIVSLGLIVIDILKI